MKKIIYILLLALLTLHAEDIASFKTTPEVQKVPDTLKLSVGAYLTGDFKSSVDFTGGDGVSVDLDIQKMFNMKTDLASAYVDAYYRITPKHRIEIGYKGTKSSGKSTASYNIEGPFRDINITGGANSHFNIAVAKLMYTYSFFHSDEIEAGVSVGLYYALFDVGVGANIEDFGGSFSFSLGQALPVLGTRLEYHIFPEWSVLYAFDIFALGGNFQLEQNDEGTMPQYLVDHFTGFEGYMSDFTLATEYRVFDNFGVGASFNYALQDFSIILDNSKEVGINNRVMGFGVYGSLHF